MRYMLDTNICIYAIKKKPEEVFRRLQQHDPSEVCISAVTYAELMHGVEKSKAVKRIALLSRYYWPTLRFWILTVWLRKVMERSGLI